jgi:hypothetical protein
MFDRGLPMISAKYSIRLALIGAVALPMSAMSLPALAFDEGRGSTIDTLLNMVGMAPAKEEETINYRERAPLVLPPKTELRQPRAPASKTSANWPQDQEAVAARKRAAAARAPSAKGDALLDFKPNPLDPNPKGLGVAANAPRECVMDPDKTRVDACDPVTFWKNLQVRDTKVDKPQLQAGVEPDRKFLTQPPKGYMAPKKTVKATFEAPPRDEQEDAGANFFRSKPKTQE